MKAIFKTICILLGIGLFCLTVWLTFSYFDVISHNIGDYNYAPWNLFVVLGE